MQTSNVARHLSLALVLAVLPTGGCGSVSDEFASSFSLACVDYGVDGPEDDRSFEGSAATATLERCVYYHDSKQLAVNFAGETGVITIDIVGFSGAGTYKTGAAEAQTSIHFATDTEASGGTWESDPPGTFPAHACTVTVTETDLHDVTPPADGAGQGNVVFDVDCAKIGTGAVGKVECTVSPATFHFSVAACEVVSG